MATARSSSHFLLKTPKSLSWGREEVRGIWRQLGEICSKVRSLTARSVAIESLGEVSGLSDFSEVGPERSNRVYGASSNYNYGNSMWYSCMLSRIDMKTQAGEYCLPNNVRRYLSLTVLSTSDGRAHICDGSTCAILWLLGWKQHSILLLIFRRFS